MMVGGLSVGDCWEKGKIGSVIKPCFILEKWLEMID
jgi:hypothetical protein